MASKKRYFGILAAVVVLAVALTWIVRRPNSRVLPPEFSRRLVHDGVSLTKILVVQKDRILVAGTTGEVLHGKTILDELKPLPTKGDGPTTLLSFADDGLILAGDSTGLLRSWQLPQFEYQSVDSPRVPVTSAVFQKVDGNLRIILGLSDGRLLVIHEGESRLIETKHRGVKALATDPQGMILGLAGASGRVSFYDIKSMDVLATSPLHLTEIAGIEWSPDGRLIATGDWNGEVKLLDAKTFEMVATGEQPDAVSQLHWQESSLVTSSWDGSIRRWQRLKKKLSVTAEIATGLPILDFTIGPDGQLLTVNGGSTVEFWK